MQPHTYTWSSCKCASGKHGSLASQQLQQGKVQQQRGWGLMSSIDESKMKIPAKSFTHHHHHHHCHHHIGESGPKRQWMKQCECFWMYGASYFLSAAGSPMMCAAMLLERCGADKEKKKLDFSLFSLSIFFVCAGPHRRRIHLGSTETTRWSCGRALLLPAYKVHSSPLSWSFKSP